MGWFDDQIKQRKELNEEVLDETFRKIASSITGKAAVFDAQNLDLMSENAIEDILKFYHVKVKEIPTSVTDLEGMLDHMLKPAGIMRRVVTLDKGWYTRACGALLGSLKESGIIIALIPANLGGYYYWDRTTGKKVKVNSFNEDSISEEAIAFYKPFPQRELGLSDLIVYIKNTLSFADIVLMLAMTGIVTILAMIVPAVNNVLLKDILPSKQMNVLVAAAVLLACINISKIIFQTIGELGTKKIEERMDVAVEAATMIRVLSMPADFFKKYSSGHLSQLLTYVNSVCNTLTSCIFQTGLTAVFSILYVFQIIAYAPSLVIPAFTMILINILFSIISTMIGMKISKEKMEDAAKESGLSFAMISGMQKIKLSGAENRAFAKWGKVYANSVRLNYNPPVIISENAVISMAISLAGTFWMYYAALKSGISVADYYSFTTLYGMVSAAFIQVSSIALSFAQLKPILEIIDPILKTVPETSESKHIVTKLTGSIELDSLSFSYDDNGPLIFDDLSLKIKPGQYVAIVGKTGCGKSTLLRLLLGMEKPQKGAIYYDGRDLNSVDLPSLRRHIGTVIQNGKLFNEDIYSNIAISCPGLSMDEAWEAAELAGVADDIRKMPMGMFTVLSEEGGISGGQKQRLLIARAIAPKPKILMFDEATSALDNITQRKVKEALDDLKCTRIVIAHRLSTIKECDRILVLDQGQIIEDGTYDELMARNGFFAELIERQKI